VRGGGVGGGGGEHPKGAAGGEGMGETEHLDRHRSHARAPRP
jgi:hypothetical protein